MKRQETANTFSEGLILDLNPLSMPNNALTNCLNGTLLTYNGNENMLLNDMGNARIETAMLPEGYIPLGSTSFGGIIYIVSYNPIDKKYLIGSFPSPERNLTKDEIGDNTETSISLDKFCDGEWKFGDDNFGDSDNKIVNYYLKVNLLKSPIYPGDKYKVFSPNLKDHQGFISALSSNNTKYDPNLFPKYLKLDIAAILDNGKTISLTNDSVWTKIESSEEANSDNKFYIYLGNIENDNGLIDLEEYRGLVGSNYDTYQSKVSGKLAIVAKLEVPTSFSVNYDVLTDSIDSETKQFYFYLNWANDNEENEHKNRINPSSIKYSVGNGNLSNSVEIRLYSQGHENEEPEIPNSINDKNYLETIAPEDFYLELFNITNYLTTLENRPGLNLRKNDGTDFQYLIKGPTIKKKDGKYYLLEDNKTKETEIDMEGSILLMKITPCMPFGQLEFLTKTISLDMDKLQTGEINLHNYLYYVDENEINMDFNIESYPELGKSIKKGSLTFYSLSDYLSESEWLKLDTYVSNPVYEDLTKNYKKAFEKDLELPIGGLLHITINNTSEFNVLNNKIYIAKLSLLYGTGSEESYNRFFYRLFFNSTVFNKAYGLNRDFSDLYLYSEEQEYGLKLSLNIKNSSNSSYDASLVYNFDSYKEEKTTTEELRLYKIKHSIDSTFELETGLLKELALEANTKKLVDNSFRITADIPEKISLTDYKYSISIDENKISLNNTFNTIIPYVVNYADPVSLPKYFLKNLVDGANTHKVVLGSSAKNENEGSFSIVVGLKLDAVSNSENVEAFLYVADLVRNVSFSMSLAESVMKGYMNAFGYDYITVLFGVLRYGDNNCGYGFREYGLSGSDYFYKLKGEPRNYLATMTCLRYGDSVIFAHKKSLHLSNLGKILETDDKYDSNRISYRNFDALMKTKKSTDGMIIPTTIGTTYDCDYRKYVRDSGFKTLFFIDNINYEQNPNIAITYDFELEITEPTLIIDGKTIKQPQNLESFVNNLFIKNLESFKVSIPITTSINNQDFIQSNLILDSTIAGWDGTETLSQEKLSLVLTKNNNIVDDLIVDNGVVKLSEDTFTKTAMTEWFFGWEDTGGHQQSVISEEQFKDSKLWNMVLYTYAMSGLTSGPAEDVLELSYLLSCNTETFEKGLTYNVVVDRANLPEEFTGGTILISCTGGQAKLESFDDSGTSIFNTIIQVTPTESTCTITLIYDLKNVGSYTFKGVLEPEPEPESLT